MSGPKLSEYELEQLRKAELERIQREIENLHANILRIKKDIFSETEWCRHELDQMERQINLVNGCSLSEEERSQAHSIIASERQRICDLLRSMDAITSHVITHPNELKEVQAEERHIRDFWSRLIESKAMILTDRIEYESVMANVAEKIKGTLGCSTLSLAEALQNVHPVRPESISASTDIEQMRAEMLSEIVSLKRSRFASKKIIERLDNAAQLVSDEIDFKRLNDINSRVIKELSHSFAKMESIYDEYKNVFYRHNTLLSRLGKPTLEEDSFNNAAEMIARIDTIKAENESLHQQLLAIAERQEICNSIDKAMISLGYDLIGTKNASTKGCAKLYQFSKGTGIQMIQKEDGTVRLKVVGLSKRNRPPRESEKEHLLHMQEEFCSAYEQIKEAFIRQGICQVQGTERKRPPDNQFSQIINVDEYNSTYGGENGTLASIGRNSRASVYKPKYMTQDI